jgi:uncharacterized protein
MSNVILLAFLTGLTTGGFSCLAIQGGLLASSITSTNGSENRWKYVAMFLAAKLFAYTLLGFILGWVGSTLTLTPKLLGWTQILVGLFMLITAARILDLHPIFRYFVIQPPKWVYRMLKNKSRDASFFAPAMLGFLTILMPCGITQATMAVAVASGSPWLGALIMFAFILGTSPIFFVLGASFVELLKRKAFSVVAACVVIIFAVLSINGGMGLLGSIYTIQNFYKAATTDTDTLARGGVTAGVTGGVQNVSITVNNGGYTASATTLKVGVPVHITLTTNNTQGCIRAFTIPDLNLSKVLPETGTETIDFTPQQTGRLAYSCSMGMYTGAFTVVN